MPGRQRSKYDRGPKTMMGETNRTRPMGYRLLLLDFRKCDCTLQMLFHQLQRWTNYLKCRRTPPEQLCHSHRVNLCTANGQPVLLCHGHCVHCTCVPFTSVSPFCFLSLVMLAAQKLRGKSAFEKLSIVWEPEDILVPYTPKPVVTTNMTEQFPWINLY